MVTGLVTVNGNSKGDRKGLFVIDQRIGPMSGFRKIRLVDGKIQIIQTDYDR